MTYFSQHKQNLGSSKSHKAERVIQFVATHSFETRMYYSLNEGLLNMYVNFP